MASWKNKHAGIPKVVVNKSQMEIVNTLYKRYRRGINDLNASTMTKTGVISIVEALSTAAPGNTHQERFNHMMNEMKTWLVEHGEKLHEHTPT